MMLRDLVLVKEQVPSSRGPGGIFLPDTRGEKANGSVMAVGPDCARVTEGDVVLYHRFTGVEVLVGERREPALAIRERELIGKWTKEGATMDLQPIGDRLVVKPDPPEELTASGIVLPAQAQEGPQTGTVKAVGTLQVDLAPGDKVLYSKYGGTPVLAGGEDCLMLREADVLARLTPEGG